jgi:hypothetical protein
MTEAILARNKGMVAVLIFRNWAVISRILSGVPITATNLSEIINNMAARTILKRRIDVSAVLIGCPGPSDLCIPLPTKKKIAKTKVS